MIGQDALEKFPSELVDVEIVESPPLMMKVCDI